MAKGKVQYDGYSLRFLSPAGATDLEFNLLSVHPSLRDAVFAYGAKQILADAGAVGRNVPDEERIGKMTKRATALIRGTWSFRDGFSAPSPQSNSALQFACLVEAAIVPGDDPTRAAWQEMKPAERAAIWTSDEAAPARALYDGRRPKPSADVGALLARLGVSV